MILILNLLILLRKFRMFLYMLLHWIHLVARNNKERLKNIFLNIFACFVVLVLLRYFFSSRYIIYTNDYLNPFTLTFKNPKTVEMLNIIVLYHYVMSFLIGIIVFTFIFIFLSFFRSYPLFYIKPFYNLDEEVVETDWFATLMRSKIKIDAFLLGKKREYMEFYREDIRRALNDQVTHAPILEFL